MRIEPLPHGQMPAMARNRVDFPAPVGPGTRVASLGRMLKPLAETWAVPLGSRISSCSISIASLPDGTISIEGCSDASVVALLTDISKPSRRATNERKYARLLLVVLF